jgi:hypothetical protein
MSLRLQVIHASEFIRTTPQGTLDLAATKQILRSVALAAQDMEKYHILIDARDATSAHLSTTDLWELAAELEHLDNFRMRRTALLVPGTGEGAEFFKLCAENRGFSVNVFKDYEEAINWLFRATTLPAPEVQTH